MVGMIMHGNFTLSLTALLFSRTLDVSTSPKHLSLGKVATGLASVNSGLNEWRGSIHEPFVLGLSRATT
jgi:hypothetical protein